MSTQTTEIVHLATPSNMRRFAGLHPGRDLPGGGHVEGRRCFAYSPNTGEEFSASAGDHWQLPDDEPLTDRDGEPMILAVSETIYRHAFSGEPVEPDRCRNALELIAAMVPTEDEWRSAADFMEAVADIVAGAGIAAPEHYAE